MTSHVAAQSFVEAVLTEVVRDAQELAHQYHEVYQPIEDAVRAELGVPIVNLDRLEQAIRDAAADDHRSAVSATLLQLIGTHADDVRVKQQAAYLMGVAVGCTVHPVVARKVGAR
jgi:hypothetical protein